MASHHDLATTWNTTFFDFTCYQRLVRNYPGHRIGKQGSRPFTGQDHDSKRNNRMVRIVSIWAGIRHGSRNRYKDDTLPCVSANPCSNRSSHYTCYHESLRTGPGEARDSCVCLKTGCNPSPILPQASCVICTTSQNRRHNGGAVCYYMAYPAHTTDIHKSQRRQTEFFSSSSTPRLTTSKARTRFSSSCESTSVAY